MKHKDKKSALSAETLNQYCNKLRFIMETNQLYLRPRLSLDDLSLETGIPLDYIRKVLDEKLKMTFFEFISEYKIDEAKRLLTKEQEDHFSISTIANKSGFNTNDSFITLFRKHTKMSPQEYRIKYINLTPDFNNSILD